MQVEERVKGELILLLACSWLFFPFMLKPLWPSVVVGSFLAILVAVVYVNRRSIGLGCISVPANHIPDALLYFLYFLGLAAATLIAQDGDGVAAMFVIISRIVFFVLVLCLINEKTVIASLDLYASIVAALSFLAVAAMLYRYFGGTALVDARLNSLNIQVYFGAYYRAGGGYICPGWFPIQGLVEEPGTWAFCLLPALLWAQLARRNPLVVGLIGLNLILTGSFGVALFIFGVAILLNKQANCSYDHKNDLRVLVLIAVAIVFVLVFGTVCHSTWFTSGIASGAISTSGMTLGGKALSLWDRIEEMKKVLGYLSSNPWGAGAGIGMGVIGTALSSGFVSTLADAGVIGGAAYLLFYALLLYRVNKLLWTTQMDQNKTLQVLSLSVLALIFMGMQRGKSDASMFHVWLLALFFFHANRSVAKNPSWPGFEKSTQFWCKEWDRR